jgi:preprotein translocase subunit SecD
MKSWRLNINAFFFGAFFLAAMCGCKTTEQRKAEKEQTLVSLHLEVNPDGSPRNAPVPIYRASPQMINVVLQPFLTTEEVESASIVDLDGGFGIQLKFNKHGANILEMYTGRYRGKRIAINCAFPEIRWVAAPRIMQTITDGVLIFTPDATREESERIVRGINNVAKAIRAESLI